jgi:hypothetical protein
VRNLSAIVYLALPAFLLACDRQQPAADIDPQLGLACFEHHRAELPPGTQYEGIDHLADNRLTIKIMNGMEVVMMDCALNADGTLQSAGT